MITNALNNGRYNYIIGYHVNGLDNTSSKCLIGKLDLLPKTLIWQKIRGYTSKLL
jgi:hypothetical protein